MSRRKITGTANFVRNLEGLRGFHTEHPQGFERAVARLQDEFVPLLRQQANVGRPYERGQPSGRAIIENIRARLGGGVLRELVVDEYVVLYLVSAKRVALMSIRHGRELDFDFGD